MDDRTADETTGKGVKNRLSKERKTIKFMEDSQDRAVHHRVLRTPTRKTMKIYGIVRLSKDVELRYSQGAQPMAIASFSIACERKIKREGEPEADFFDCVAFGAKAEFIGKYLKKGSRVFLEGDLRNDNYVNKEGIKVYRNRVYVETIEFADSKANDGTTQATTTQTQAAAPAQTQATRQAVAPAQAPAPAAPAQAPATKRTTTRKAAAPAQAPVQAPAQNGFMAIPEGMGDMPFFN